MRMLTVILLSIMGIALGYLLYLPVPSGLLHPWRGRFVAYALGAAETMASLAEKQTGKPMGLYLSEWSNVRDRRALQSYPQLEVEDKVLDGVEVRLYRRKAVPGLIPAVVYFHGGGWVMGNIDLYIGMNARMALLTNMTIVAVNYRKAPAYPYPVPFEDCLRATQYVLTHGEELGVDSKQVTVSGDSAGGNLAAAVALKLSQEDPSVMPPLKLQVLLCPALQAITFNSDSYRHSPKLLISQERMILFWASYLGVPYNSNTLTLMLNDKHVSTTLQKSLHGSYVGKGQSIEVKDEYDVAMADKLDKLVVDPFIAPLMASEKLLKKAAPAYVVAFEFDQLKDDAVLYADRLKSSGVNTYFRVVKGQTHPGLPSLTPPFKLFDNSDYEELVEDVAKYIVKMVAGK